MRIWPCGMRIIVTTTINEKKPHVGKLRRYEKLRKWKRNKSADLFVRVRPSSTNHKDVFHCMPKSLINHISLSPYPTFHQPLASSHCNTMASPKIQSISPLADLLLHIFGLTSFTLSFTYLFSHTTKLTHSFGGPFQQLTILCITPAQSYYQTKLKALRSPLFNNHFRARHPRGNITTIFTC